MPPYQPTPTQLADLHRVATLARDIGPLAVELIDATTRLMRLDGHDTQLPVYALSSTAFSIHHGVRAAHNLLNALARTLGLPLNADGTLRLDDERIEGTPPVLAIHPDAEARRAQLARLWADADGDDGRVKGTLHPNDRIAMGPGVLIADDAPELPDAEAEHEARQIDYAEAVRNFTLPEGEPCVGDSLCRCGRCAVFAAG